MWSWRRRRPPPPVLLPSLDRLAELIERVVALLDQVSLAPAPDPASHPKAVAEDEIVLKQRDLDPVAGGWLALVHSSDGYCLLQRDGPPPERGAAVELDDGDFLVLGLGPSPLPHDRRRCAYLESREAAPSGMIARNRQRQEPPPAERTLDG